MEEFIIIPDVIISAIKKTEVKDFESGIQKLNILYHFLNENINNQIKTAHYMSSLKLFDSEIRIPAEMPEYNLFSVSEIPDYTYKQFTNIRNYFLIEHPFINYSRCQKHMLRLIKDIEILYYLEYEIEDLDGIIKDIENKINYMDEFKEEFEAKANEINEDDEDSFVEDSLKKNEEDVNYEIDETSYSKYISTYNLLQYLYSVYTAVKSAN